MQIKENVMKQLLLEIICGLLILLFLYTAISKIADYAQFRIQLSNSPSLSPYAGVLSWLVPVIEIIIVILLFFPLYRKSGMYASLILLTLFTGYLIYMVIFTPDLPCSCGGVLQILSWREHIIFNLVFMMLSFYGIVLDQRSKNRRSSPPP